VATASEWLPCERESRALEKLAETSTSFPKFLFEQITPLL
jgi:hypothetical protein